MKHRHIDTQGYILPERYDIISRGNRNDWVELRDASLADPSIKQKIIDICKHYSYVNSLHYDFCLFSLLCIVHN